MTAPSSHVVSAGASERHTLPRIVIAAPASGGGKTTITTGLLAALRARGLRVSPHKVGPDYIDPGYHAAASGRLGRNLDPHLVGERRLVPLLLHGARVPEPADVAVIEGVMGLFDGVNGRDGFASTAHIAEVTGSPVVLVVNCASSARSVGAVVAGFAGFEPAIRVAGVILNNLASPRHEAEARAGVARTGVPVVGAVPRMKEIAVPSRHLGLIPAAEREPEAAEAVAALARVANAHLDLDLIMSIAQSAPDLEGVPWSADEALREAGYATAQDAQRCPPVVAVAGGEAFTFGYGEHVELLEAAGAEVVVFDPLTEEALPSGTSAVFLPGGFPEVHATRLTENVGMREAIRRFAGDGGPVVGECAGMLYLARSLDGVPMTGVLPIDTEMSPRLTLGYHDAVAGSQSFLVNEGERITGHTFHRTHVTHSDLPNESSAWRFIDREGAEAADGYVNGNVHAAYLHTHWAGYPQFAARLVEAARGRG